MSRAATILGVLLIAASAVAQEPPLHLDALSAVVEEVGPRSDLFLTQTRAITREPGVHIWIVYAKTDRMRHYELCTYGMYWPYQLPDVRRFTASWVTVKPIHWGRNYELMIELRNTWGSVAKVQIKPHRNTAPPPPRAAGRRATGKTGRPDIARTSF